MAFPDENKEKKKSREKRFFKGRTKQETKSYVIPSFLEYEAENDKGMFRK